MALYEYGRDNNIRYIAQRRAGNLGVKTGRGGGAEDGLDDLFGFC